MAHKKFNRPSVTKGRDGTTIEIFGWNKTCKYCGKRELRWVGTTDDTGHKKWHLEERAHGTPSGVQSHKCPEYNRSTERTASGDKVEVIVYDEVQPTTPAPPENYGEW